MKNFLQRFERGAVVVVDVLLYPALPLPSANGESNKKGIGPSLNWPESSASSQTMIKAPPALYSCDWVMSGTFCLSHVSPRSVLFAGSVVSQGEMCSCPSWQRFGVMKLNRAEVWSAKSVASR